MWDTLATAVRTLGLMIGILLWLGVAGAAAYAAITFVAAPVAATGGLVLSIAIIPYVFARAWEKLTAAAAAVLEAIAKERRA